jgi:hypothetical protein
MKAFTYQHVVAGRQATSPTKSQIVTDGIVRGVLRTGTRCNLADRLDRCFYGPASGLMVVATEWTEIYSCYIARGSPALGLLNPQRSR